jgi:glycosyltransferase involved in cell wall biosynthesis
MRIFFVHSGTERFVKLDRELLSESFDVRDFYAEHKFPADFWKYWHGIIETDFVFCWFASWNSFWALLLAWIFRKPSALVIGGYDLANLPEANYGHQRGGIAQWVSRWSMNLATLLLPFSCYSQGEAEKNAHIQDGRMKMIYIGIPDPHHDLSKEPKERLVLTVGNVDKPNLKRKGIEPFVRAAALLPDVKFVVVGAWLDDAINYLRTIASSNVIFSGWVGPEELLEYYRRASVYVQASLHEGFGLSVAEAMLAGCIPVTTQAGSLPEVVGECGIYCMSTQPPEIARAAEIAMNAPIWMREKARQRILDLFPLESRREKLNQVIRAIVDNENSKR